MSWLKTIFQIKEKSESVLDGLESRENIEQKRFKKQMRTLILLGLVALFSIIVAFLITWSDKVKKAQEEYVRRQEVAQSNIPIERFAYWQTVKDREILQIQTDIQALDQNMSTNLEKGIGKISQELNSSISALSQRNEEFFNTQVKVLQETKDELNQKIATTQLETVGYINRKIKETEDNIASTHTAQDGIEIKEGALFLPSPSNNNATSTTKKLAHNADEIKEVVIEEAIVIQDDPLLTRIDTPKEPIVPKEEKIEFHIPMGMAKGTIVSGVNAPVMNFGNSGDITSNPIFISIDSGITIANNHNLRAEECMLLGAAAGQLVDARGTVILNKISCVFTDHRNGKTYKVEDRIEGWVYGEDGLVGVKGRLITKEGDIIATALPLALLETAMTYITEKAKTGTTIVSGQDLGLSGYVASGADKGGSEVLEKLSDIYIRYLDELNPVVSILPGRDVTIAFRGTTAPLVLQEFTGLDVAFFDNQQYQGYYRHEKINDRSLYE